MIVETSPLILELTVTGRFHFMLPKPSLDANVSLKCLSDFKIILKRHYKEREAIEKLWEQNSTK